MQVPGNWEIPHDGNKPHGFPIYTNIGTAGPLDLTPPIVTYRDKSVGGDYNPTGVYKRTLPLPNGFCGQDDDIFLRLGAVTSAVYLNVDGVDVGYSQDSKLPAVFNITKALQQRKKGDAMSITITLVVLCWCDGAFIEDQDMWWLAGITRECCLFSRPRLYIQDFFARSSPTLGRWAAKFASISYAPV
jgi:beta-galactosidase